MSTFDANPAGIFEKNRYDQKDGGGPQLQKPNSSGMFVRYWLKVRKGVEVIVEQDHRPVAVIRPPHRSGRPISEIVRQARERNSEVTLDSDFGKDLEAIIESHQQPWNPAAL